MRCRRRCRAGRRLRRGLALKVKFTVVFVKTNYTVPNEWRVGAADVWHAAGSSWHTLVEWIPGTRDSYTIEATSLPDAWKQMKAKLKGGDQITEIVFVGHGSAGKWLLKEKPEGNLVHRKANTTSLDRDVLDNPSPRSREAIDAIAKWMRRARATT